jgi:PAS domain S-box-containing protein
MVRVKNGEDIIYHFNKQFVEMFEFDKEEDVIGFKIKELCDTPEDYPKFIEELKEKDKQKQPLLDRLLRVRSRKGKNMVIEVNSRLLHDRHGNIIGRAGVVREITEEARLRQRVKEFTDDIGSVLHDYTATLSSVQLSIKAVMQSFGPDPFEGKTPLSPEQAVLVLYEPTRNLIKSLDKLLELAKSEERSTALVADKWNELSKLVRSLQGLEQIPYLEFRPPTVRLAAYRISEICNEIEEGRFPRETVRQVKKNAGELMRICSFVALHQANDTIIAMDPQVRSLREYVTFSARIKEPKAVCRIGTLIHRAVTNLDEFAKNREVNIKFKIEDPTMQVEVIERDVIRALTNLLHNAIKYSWSRKEGERPWILITTHIVENQTRVEVENYGVALPKDEIDKGLIFQIGYRGRLSSDRGRVGTGVGLADARRVAREHGGDVTLESHPATPGGKEDDYNRPFLTTAILRLPIFIRQGGKNETKNHMD